MSATAPFQGRRDGMALLVLAKFRQLGPMTVRDAAAACGKRVQHVAPRVSELIECGALVPDMGVMVRQAPSGRGRRAVVYKASE